MFIFSDSNLLMITSLLIGVSLFSFLCCLCMNLSDLRLRNYILRMANKKGVKVNLDRPCTHNHSTSSQSMENCTIIVPDVGIIL